jgi:hypothetical protein
MLPPGGRVKEIGTSVKALITPGIPTYVLGFWSVRLDESLDPGTTIISPGPTVAGTTLTDCCT